MGGAVGYAHQLANLLKRQSAPNPGNHNLPLFQWERFQCRGSRSGVDPVGGRPLEPLGTLGCRHRFVAPPPPRRPHCAEGSIAHYPIEPCRRIIGRRDLARQADQGLLDNILGAVAQLSRIKLQRGGVPIKQPPDKVRRVPGRSCWSRSRSPSLRRRPMNGVPRDLDKKSGAPPDWGVPRPQLHRTSSVLSRPRPPPRIMKVVAVPRQ